MGIKFGEEHIVAYSGHNPKVFGPSVEKESTM